MTILFAILSPVFYLIGFLPYLYQSIYGKVVPHTFTWSIAAILSGIHSFVLYQTAGWDIFLLSPIVRTLALITGGVV